MKKILTILLFVIGLQAFSQTYVPNQFLYNWTRGAEFSGDVIFSSLTSGTDTIFLVVNSATGTIDTIGITELKTIFGGGSGDVSFSDTNTSIATKYDLDTLTISTNGVSRAELGDSTSAVRTDLTEDILLRLEIADTSGMLNTYSRLQDLSDTAAVLRGLINSGSGGSGGLNDTIVISGGRDTITNTSEEVLYISLNNTGEDTLYLANSLNLDSLSNVYIENHRDGLLVIDGGLNSLNEQINTALNVPARGAVFIKCLGIIDGVRRFSAIGNYTQQ